MKKQFNIKQKFYDVYLFLFNRVDMNENYLEARQSVIRKIYNER